MADLGTKPSASTSSAATRLRAELVGLEQTAHGLADRLPDLLLEAERIAATVAHGLHGRRRAGPGETFWQFRQYASTDSASTIDWRRSASSDQLYVREREWEAAHTVWLWPDLSGSMAFRSHLATTTKRDRALVVMLAAAELLVRGGERVGLLGLSQPMATRHAARKLAEILARSTSHPQIAESLPPKAQLSRFSGAVLLSDFLDPIDVIKERLETIAASGVTAHLVQILDPAEETLPYTGRAEFFASEGGERWLAERTESLRPAYVARLQAHRAALQALATRLGWSFLVHHTDHSPSDVLLALTVRLQGKDVPGVSTSAVVEPTVSAQRQLREVGT
jgi:uncharacterized protein (DUF58 family)